MKPRTLRLAVASTVLSLGLVLSACGSSASPAASVGESEITDAQVTHEADLFSFLAALNQSPCGTKEGDETEESACNRFALSNLIQQRFVQDFAGAEQLVVSDKEVSDVIGTLDSQLGKAKVDDELQKQSLTRADLDGLARSVLLFQKVEERIAADQLGDEQLQKLYREQILGFTTVQVDHILVKTEAQANDVYRQVTRPGFDEKAFLALAKKVSIDPGVDQNSGSLGSAVASTYVPEFGQAAAALEPGEISQPVQSQFGWHVIRLNQKQVTPFAQAKQSLVQDQQTTIFNDWLRKQADDQGVDVNPRYGRFDQATLSVLPIRSTDPSDTATPAESGASQSPSVPATASSTP